MDASESSSRDEPVVDPDDPAIDPPGPDWLYRLRRRWAGDSRLRQMVWRAVSTGIGSAIVVVGIVLLPLPGPGWAIIFLGLAVLATEYVWAHRLLRFTKQKAQGAASSAFSPENRRRTWALILIGSLLAAAVIALYVEQYGWSLGGARGWVGLD
ncbi:MAG: TIGR02611 family protein [Actinomycetota bacterium]|nr:TIGR02611 family protein [Actinomycetota bacterium]MDH5278316.1 TIGR02611 family protein [Actinomycetota bacterium]